MAQQDQSQGQQTEQQWDQQSGQMPHSQYDQSQFDTAFLSQISGQFQTVDYQREYYEAIEQQVRSARRVAEVSAIAHLQSQIVARTAQLVRQQLLSDPTVKQMISQQVQQGSQGSQSAR